MDVSLNTQCQLLSDIQLGLATNMQTMKTAIEELETKLSTKKKWLIYFCFEKVICGDLLNICFNTNNINKSKLVIEKNLRVNNYINATYFSPPYSERNLFIPTFNK